MSDTGKLIIITAPSGAGKTTIGKYLLAHIPQLSFSVSATTRAPRENEKHGVDYYFLTAAQFDAHIANNDFLEWEEVYPGRRYGTLRSEADRLWAAGRHIIFDIDVKGAIHLQSQFRENTLSLFIAPPSLEELRRRLEGRKSETAETIALRMERASMEMSKKALFNHIVVNDDLDLACKQAFALVTAFLNG